MPSEKDQITFNSFTVLFQVDIGECYKYCKSLNNEQKYEVLQNRWKPEPGYLFIVNSAQRKFQHKLLAN